MWCCVPIGEEVSTQPMECLRGSWGTEIAPATTACSPNFFPTSNGSTADSCLAATGADGGSFPSCLKALYRRPSQFGVAGSQTRNREVSSQVLPAEA